MAIFFAQDHMVALKAIRYLDIVDGTLGIVLGSKSISFKPNCHPIFTCFGSQQPSSTCESNGQNMLENVYYRFEIYPKP